jgi:hypothetical protein
MARGRKSGPTRMDLRRQNDAAETREDEEKEVEEEEEDGEDDEDDEEEDEAEAEADAEPDSEDDGDEGDDDDEDAPKKKKKKKVKEKKVVVKKPTKRKTVKEIRMKAYWIVLDNSGKRAGSFAYNDKKSAEELLAKKLEEKSGFYIQLAKEPLEV